MLLCVPPHVVAHTIRCVEVISTQCDLHCEAPRGMGLGGSPMKGMSSSGGRGLTSSQDHI